MPTPQQAQAQQQQQAQEQQANAQAQAQQQPKSNFLQVFTSTFKEVANDVAKSVKSSLNQTTKQTQQPQKVQETNDNQAKQLTQHDPMDKYLSSTQPTKKQTTQQSPKDSTQEQTLPKGHNPFFVFKNTGIDYFDKKKEITLFDALIAKHLGVDLRKTYVKNDLDVDLKQRQIQGSDTAKMQKSLAQLTHSINNFAKSIDEGEGVSNWIARGANALTGGLIGISETNQKIMANEETLGKQLADLLLNGRSTQDERNRLYDLVKFKGRSKEQIASNLTEILRLVRDNYAQNLQDFSNRGFTPSDEMIQDYYYIIQSIKDLQKLYQK